MNIHELQRIISRYVKRFDRVFSSDALPKKPRLLACSTDPSDIPGEHWIAIYVDDDITENISTCLVVRLVLYLKGSPDPPPPPVTTP